MKKNTIVHHSEERKKASLKDKGILFDNNDP